MNCTIPVESIQSIAHDNYRLTRALWFAMYAPDAGRHDALLSEDIPDVYRRLFDAILDGSRGLAQVAIAGGDELALLDVVAQLPRPTKIKTQRRELPHDLATDLFADAADAIDAIEIDAIGTGVWPAPPQHTCAAAQAHGSAIVIRPNETYAARMITPTWRTCPACLHKRVKRIARQILITIAAAGAMSYAELPLADYRKWTSNIRQHRKRAGAKVLYRALPQDDGRVFVMSTHGLAGAPVPTDRGALYDLIKPYAITPDGRRASSSQGFGGDYRKLRGDGRKDKGIRLWTDASLEDVAHALGAQVKRGRRTIRVQIDGHDAMQRLADANIALRTQKGQPGAAMALALAHADVTHKVHSDIPQEYTLSVTHAGDGGDMAPQRHPRLFEDADIGGAPCDIYLV